MKNILIVFLMTVTGSLYSQNKNNYTRYNNLIEVKGTEYVIASIRNNGKFSSQNRYLLFINTITGDSHPVNFAKGAYIRKIEQVKIDSLNINKIIIQAKTINYDGDNSIDWSDPSQILILSPDGLQKNQLTEDSFYLSTWVVNNQTGTITVTGHYDTNENFKYDKKDLNKIMIYDLKTLTLISKI